MTPLSLRMQAGKAKRSRTAIRQLSCQRWTPRTLDSQKQWSLVLQVRLLHAAARSLPVLLRCLSAIMARPAELIAATGWLAHTTRATLTGLRKRGYAVTIDRSDEKRGSFYRIPAGETVLVEESTNSKTAERKEQGRSEAQGHQAA
jgi:hypothetical protein